MKEMKKLIEDDPGFPKLKTGYTVPEGYFDSFGDRLKVRIELAPKATQPRRIAYYIKPALGLAAGLAIMLSVYLRVPQTRESAVLVKMQNELASSGEELVDPLPSTYASLVTEGQFLTALTEMDDYDASKMSKDGLADYLASNCSDLEILNANK